MYIYPIFSNPRAPALKACKDVWHINALDDCKNKI